MDKSKRNPPAGEGAFHTHPEGEAAAQHWSLQEVDTCGLQATASSMDTQTPH